MTDSRGRFDSEGRRRLRALLAETSAKEVARICGVEPATLRSLANGVNEGPRVRLLYKLAAVYGIRGEWWITPPGKVSDVVTSK